MDEESDGEVIDNRELDRFELRVDGHRAFAAYEREPGRIVFTHVIVPPALEGRGIGSRLVMAALAAARSEGRKVVPRCPFVRGYIDRHPEEQDLLA